MATIPTSTEARAAAHVQAKADQWTRVRVHTHAFDGASTSVSRAALSHSNFMLPCHHDSGFQRRSGTPRSQHAVFSARHARPRLVPGRTEMLVQGRAR
ncbi:hypothetical protein F1559_004630 [Cyanidiococcus yangmingshanensis]|uniref:Uncharacterized protein n=1 Tax=Cyanidiococcus yangmingshanensis TaxID=2690220 RepID=A0A7J7IPE2_9RHOD|nr:hypothetical protein F1559_004630 [Cyanidiococcus yangmingshanensis]